MDFLNNIHLFEAFAVITEHKHALWDWEFYQGPLISSVCNSKLQECCKMSNYFLLILKESLVQV